MQTLVLLTLSLVLISGFGDWFLGIFACFVEGRDATIDDHLCLVSQ
jgi:hypothetical protein